MSGNPDSHNTNNKFSFNSTEKKIGLKNWLRLSNKLIKHIFIGTFSLWVAIMVHIILIINFVLIQKKKNRDKRVD